MSSSRERYLLLAGIAGSAIAALLAQLVLSQFAAVLLNNYEITLPRTVRFVLEYRYAVWALPLLVLAVWAAWPRRSSRGVAACSLGFGSLVLVAGALLAASFSKLYVTI